MSALPLLCYTQQSLIQHFLLKKQLVKAILESFFGGNLYAHQAVNI